MELTFADTETASLEGGVCDIGIVKTDADLNIIWQSESLIDPERPINPSASGIHHITDAMVWDKPTLAEYMDLVGHPFATDDLIIAGHNIQFDVRMLGEWVPKSHRKFCTLKLARVLWPDAEDHKLQTLRYQFSLDAGTAHRALGDVMACISLVRKVRDELGHSVEDQLAMMRKPLSLDAKFPFGKHKGTKIREIPISYVRWALDKMELDPDLREALASRL